MDSLKKLSILTERSTQFRKDGFSINIADREQEWQDCVSACGRNKAYAEMAAQLCRHYENAYGEPFLFTEECIAWEIRYHFDAYMSARGFRGFPRHITTYAFSRESLIRHCRVIDISTDDVGNLKQRLMFGYRRGIRPLWRGTERDPFHK